MQKNHYSKDLILILVTINILPQILLFFFTGTYNLTLLVIGLVISALIWFNLTQKQVQKSIQEEVIERSSALMASLQQAITQKNLEEPLLAKRNSNEQQLNTRLNIASIYLLLCIVGIRQSKGRITYVNSKQFNLLLQQTQPVLKKIYVTRGTRTERIPEFIQNNYQQIKQLITNYWQSTKKKVNDPTTALQAWFEEKSHINLAEKPYIYRALSEQAYDDIEIKLLQKLCQPKKYNKLLIRIKEKAETFMALLNQSNRFAIQTSEEVLDYQYIQKYLSAFLLIFGLVIVTESHGNPSYIHSTEYQALKK